jgi:hypothetical protein
MTENNQTTVTADMLIEAVINMAVESWRFGKVFNKILIKLDAGEQPRYASHLRWFLKRTEESLSEAGLRLVNVEEAPFDPGIAATPLNIEDFEANDDLIVDQMLEPIIMMGEGVVRTGTVILKKVEL